MTELSNESIKNLNKNELKIELTNRRLGTHGTKEVLLNRLSKAIQDMDTRNTESESRNKANEMEKNTSNTSDTSVSIELAKEIFKTFEYCQKWYFRYQRTLGSVNTRNQ